jgi:hypothetical protein
MSTSDQYDRRALLEQSPELIRQIEHSIPTAADLGFEGGSAVTVKTDNRRDAALEPPTEESARSNWPKALKPEALYGLAGEIVGMIEPHSEADPAALLIQFLVGFGSVIGRQAHFVAEADRHPCNLYAVLVGQTAKGRKGTSLGQVQRILGAIDHEWSSTRVMGGLASGEGLIWAVRDAMQGREAATCSREHVDDGVRMTEYARGVIGVQTLIDAVPEIKQYANVSGEQITNVASPSLTFPIWLQMAKRINELLASKDVDGVVITHGTSPWKKPLTSSTSCSRARNPSCWWGQCVRQLPSAPTVR